jgi:hypothetical protein
MTPSRRPARLKGALPSPRMAPRRVRIRWYRRRRVQVLSGILLVALVALAVQQVLAARERAADTEALRRDIRSLERSLSVLEAPLQQALQEIDQTPGQLQTGEIQPDAFRAKTDEWLKAFRDLSQGLSERDVKPELEDARVQLVQGATVFIDGIKTLQLAAAIGDPAARDQALAQGRNVFAHAAGVYGMGKRTLEKEKVRLGMVGELERESLEAPPPLPQEEVPPAAPVEPSPSP